MPTNPQSATILHALFGGTFDPIHYGHLRPVEALAAEVGLNQVTLLPNHVPHTVRSLRPMLNNG